MAIIVIALIMLYYGFVDVLTLQIYYITIGKR